MIERLGPYKIVRMLGRGGMGTVYEGIHDETGERAAIKVLSQAFADDGNFRPRFLAEIETLKDLKHPNIVQLHGDGEEDGMLFYAMEFVDGKTLQQELQAGHRFEWPEVTKITIEICNALKHGHDYGVIHRDLKPANLLRTQDGQIKLADFGIAKSFKMSDLTVDGSVVGTADYMAPEQAEGRPVGNRTDLYSLGTVMFTLLARRPPFAGSSIPQVLHKLRYDEAPLVRRFAPAVPVELEQIISQLLEKEAENRLPTALVLANRLKAMEFGLAAGTVVDPIEAFEEPEPSPNDQPTRVSGVGDGPVTEVSPTAIDKASAGKQQGYSWNDATVVTSESDSVSNEKVQRRDDTVIDQTAPRNRFTTIEEDRKERKRAEAASWIEHLPTVGIAVVMLAFGVVIYLLLQPPSAEDLLSQIRKAANANTIKEANEDIEKFLDFYENHEDATLVRDWQLDVHCEFLLSRLIIRAKKEKLLEAEEMYVEAMRSRESEPGAARELFTQLEHAEHPGEPNPITCVVAAKHQLKRMEQSPTAH